MAAANTIEPGWYSLRGAAAYTGFSDKAIRTAVSLGKLPASPVSITGTGKSPSVRIKREHLDAWIEGRPVKTA
jgi:hypothetical protein